jgi:hypothetical protein
VEVDLWVRWNRIVYNDVEILKWNTTSGNICKNKARYLLLLDLLNRFAELNLRNVPNQLEGGNATLL